MARPHRILYPGALYHITARGNRHAAIYHDNRDRRVWLDILHDTCVRHHFTVYAYCQMTNHYHLLLQTREANLSRGMRQLNGVYSQYVNRRHRLAGHLLQGRYHAVLVQKDTHLLELARYLVLNPVRAGMVPTPDLWTWSSYRWMESWRNVPDWFDRSALLIHFGESAEVAARAYQEFVRAGIGLESPLDRASPARVLGDADFLAAAANSRPAAGWSREVPRAQRLCGTTSLEQFQLECGSRDEAMARAYGSGLFSMGEIARFFAVSYRTVGRAVARFEALARHARGNGPH